MLYRIRHRTTYRYTEPVTLAHNLVHLTPRNGGNQECRESEIEILPIPAVRVERRDFFGNPATFFSIQEPHDTLLVEARHVVRVRPRGFRELPVSPAWETVRDDLSRRSEEELMLAYAFAFESPYVQPSEELADFARPCFEPGKPLLEAARDLTDLIHEEFQYDPTATTVTTPLKQMFAQRRGVCQDFAHLQIGCLRSLGLAARYVSGYLRTEPPKGRPRLIGADASHAWISAFCSGRGWIDFDPTNGLLPDDSHIMLAWGRDYDDVSPIKGVILGGGEHRISVGVDVIPEGEAPVSNDE